jgi:hypothetical protein
MTAAHIAVKAEEPFIVTRICTCRQPDPKQQRFAAHLMVLCCAATQEEASPMQADTAVRPAALPRTAVRLLPQPTKIAIGTMACTSSDAPGTCGCAGRAHQERQLNTACAARSSCQRCRPPETLALPMSCQPRQR